MERAPERLRTLIASGDVYIRAESRFKRFPMQMWCAMDCG